EVAEAAIGRRQEAELVHEPLGVQGPTLAITRDELGPLVPGQPVALGDPAADLEVVTRDALVVPGAHVLPDRKAGAAQRRVPRLAGPAEVVRRWRVVGR